MRMEVEMVTEETRVQVAERNLVHVGPRWCDGQPVSTCQVRLTWYLDQARAPVWRGFLQPCCLSVWHVAACSVEIATPLAP